MYTDENVVQSDLDELRYGPYGTEMKIEFVPSYPLYSIFVICTIDIAAGSPHLYYMIYDTCNDKLLWVNRPIKPNQDQFRLIKTNQN